MKKAKAIILLYQILVTADAFSCVKDFCRLLASIPFFGFDASDTFPATAADAPVVVDQFLVRNINVGGNNLRLRQGFGSNLRQLPPQDGGDRTGTYTWFGGIELGNDVATNSIITVKNKRVLELGTGTGIVGIGAALGESEEVAFTDGAAEVLKIAAVNVESNLQIKLNGDSDSLAEGSRRLRNKNQYLGLGRLRWGNEEDIDSWLRWKPLNKGSSSEKYDVVLASEVGYQHKNIDLLLKTIRGLVKPSAEGGIVLLRLSPEITDDAKGLDEYFIPEAKATGFTLVSYPYLDDDNAISQIVELAISE